MTEGTDELYLRWNELDLESFKYKELSEFSVVLCKGDIANSIIYEDGMKCLNDRVYEKSDEYEGYILYKASSPLYGECTMDLAYVIELEVGNYIITQNMCTGDSYIFMVNDEYYNWEQVIEMLSIDESISIFRNLNSNVTVYKK